MMWAGDVKLDQGEAMGNQYVPPTGAMRGGLQDPSEYPGCPRYDRIHQTYKCYDEDPSKIEAQKKALEQMMREAGPKPPAPIKIVTICVDQEMGRYMAMFANDAMKRAVASSPEAATYALLVQEKVIVVEDGDLR